MEEYRQKNYCRIYFAEPVESLPAKTGRLTPVSTYLKGEAGKNRRAYARCICDCGAVTEVLVKHLKTGHSKSCGCANLDRLKTSPAALSHGMGSRHKGHRNGAYTTWFGMKSRCLNPNATHYKNYGGRGIKVCERWRDFKSFYADMGRRPEGKTLDRIDVNGNYEPSNCRWATHKEQSANRRPLKKKNNRLPHQKSVKPYEKAYGLSW